VALFYILPLRPSASIQFDTADLHYPAQKYVADRLGSGAFPFWTPYIYCGYPLAANPKVGVWYPLNWPFFLFGITPRSLEMELALHAFIACLGAWFFIRRLVGRWPASLVGAFAYGFSGFFASHSGHLDLFMAAAWFPWLLLCFRRAIRARGPQDIVLGALVGALMISTGSLAGAEFGFVGLALYAAAVWWNRRRRWKRWLAFALTIPAGALMLAAAEILPARQLAQESAPAPDYSVGSLAPRALLTLIYPDAWGAFSHSGDGRVLEHYLYSGLLLLPLAALGAWKSRHRIIGLALTVPMLWYMLGPYGGLYFAGRLIPGLQTSGPPAWGWFVAALGLAVLAASGAELVALEWRARYRLRGTRIPLDRALPISLTLFMFADLWCLNLAFNPLAFARQSWADSYGLRESVARRQLAGPELPFNRFDTPGTLRGVGPALYPLDLKLETTFGYFTWQLQAYRQYRSLIVRNSRLRDGLNVNRYLSPATNQIEYNLGVLPRVWFPPAAKDVSSQAESLKALETLNPHSTALVQSSHSGFYQDPLAEANILRTTEQSYLIHYVSRTPGLLRLSVAWYPGWHAIVQNQELPILRVDHALMGVVVPTGDNLLRFEYRQERIVLGLWITVVTAFLMALAAFVGIAVNRRRPARRPRKQRVTAII
jgi:hypothetical protein